MSSSNRVVKMWCAPHTKAQLGRFAWLREDQRELVSLPPPLDQSAAFSSAEVIAADPAIVCAVGAFAEDRVVGDDAELVAITVFDEPELLR